MGRVTYLKDLPTEVISTLIQYIRAGSFPYVAAQACGIPKSTWYRWMASGRKGNKTYRELWDKVQSAGAEARVVAENKVFGGTPLAWLRYGPGRERPGEPGWTDSRQVEHSGPGGEAIELRVVYVDDWRDKAPKAAPGPADSDAQSGEVQVAGGRAALAQDDDGDERSG